MLEKAKQIVWIFGKKHLLTMLAQKLDPCCYWSNWLYWNNIFFQIFLTSIPWDNSVILTCLFVLTLLYGFGPFMIFWNLNLTINDYFKNTLIVFHKKERQKSGGNVNLFDRNVYKKGSTFFFAKFKNNSFQKHIYSLWHVKRLRTQMNLSDINHFFTRKITFFKTLQFSLSQFWEWDQKLFLTRREIGSQK